MNRSSGPLWTKSTTLCKHTGRVPCALRLAGGAACAQLAFHFCARTCAFRRRSDIFTSTCNRSTAGVRSSMLASSGERRDAHAPPLSRYTTRRRREEVPGHCRALQSQSHLHQPLMARRKTTPPDENRASCSRRALHGPRLESRRVRSQSLVSCAIDLN